MTFKQHLKKYTQREFELSGFDKTNFGKSAITLLEDLADLCKNDPVLMKDMLGLLTRLIDMKPIAPITEDDFEVKSTDNGDKSPISICLRHPYIYRTSDGKYWNDRAIAFLRKDDQNFNKMYLYQAVHNSKQQITLPYYPEEVIEYIND